MQNSFAAILAGIAATLASLLAAVHGSIPAAPPTPPTQAAVATTSNEAVPSSKTGAAVTASAASVPAVAAPAELSPAAIAQGATPGLVRELPALRAATVNLVCLPLDRSAHGMSGSGIVIDPRGIILTAAHVGQFFLLQPPLSDYTCIVRAGSPAARAYTASVIYVSPAWVKANPTVLTAKDPTGTGEQDFALLAITGSATASPLPASFPYVPLSSDDPTQDEPVVIGSYGAEFLTSAQVRTSLYPSFAYSTVKDRYTFGDNTVDVLSLGGGATAQEGSSGGGAADEAGQLIGLVTTSSSGSDLAARDLHAITASYIERTFQQDTGKDLSSYLDGSSLQGLVATFAYEARSLADSLKLANHL